MWHIHSAGDLVMCLGDFNGNVGKHIDGGFAQRNLEGLISLVFCL